MARKRKYINRNLLKTLCECQLTDEQLAYAMKVDRTTLWRRYATAIKAWKEGGVSSMRQRLYQIAMRDEPIMNSKGEVVGEKPGSGSVSAAIFFLKNFGGMSDNDNSNRDLGLGTIPSSFRADDARQADKPN